MNKPTLDPFVRGLEVAMERTGWKAAPLSTASGLGVSAIRDLFRKGSSPRSSTARAIANTLGMTVDEISALGGGALEAIPMIAVAGRVGAGAKVPLEDAYEKGDGLYHVACPPQIGPRGVVAVEVEGDSMSPAYEAGDVLFYSRDVEGVPSEAVGRKCVVCDDSGDVWVKQVRRREGQPEGLFDLVSINTGTDPRYDVRLKWASPVRMYLPVDLVKRLNV